jgi:hypothetical protein
MKQPRQRAGTVISFRGPHLTYRMETNYLTVHAIEE